MLTTPQEKKRHLLLRKAIRLSSIGWCAMIMAGCNIQPPGGMPLKPMNLGSVVDRVNRQQEENAEAAKLIVYMHEFEPNTRKHAELLQGESKVSSEFEYEVEDEPTGFRLTPKGQDHVRQIARILNRTNQVNTNGQIAQSSRSVIVERSNTSKHWNTLHRYPVHYNDELDETRRRIVVNALYALGVYYAEQMVVVGPAYPEGLNANEAASAYNIQFNNFGQGQGGNRSFGNGGF